MSLSSLSIRRPVLSIVMSLVIMVFGVVGMRELGVREYPQFERPIISVRGVYPGANATIVESQITRPLEDEINTVEGIVSLTSTSRDGFSQIRIEFGMGDDIERAANDIRDRVSAAIRRLPRDMDPPVVTKVDADGEPILFLNIHSAIRNTMELTQMAHDLFKSRFETISGVGRVDIWGAKEYSMRLRMDPDLLAAHGLSPIDVRNAFQQANVELPSGRIEGESVDLSVRTVGRFGDQTEAFLSVVLRHEGERQVRFRDVGWVEEAPLNERSVLKRDRIPMVGVVLRPQSNANQIEIVDEFYRRLAHIQQDLPSDIQLGIGFDTSQFVRTSIREVQQTILLALGLVCLTIFLFLREGRSSLIPLITIPVSLLGGFFAIYLMGFSINVLTLLAMVLAVGLVVDDAVIVLENIYTKMENGSSPKEAASKGVAEIFAAVIATTLALVAVFAPIVFMGGMTGALFREFGITLASIVVVSSFVALTLTPSLCARFSSRSSQRSRFYRMTEPFFVGLNRGYLGLLHRLMRFRPLVIGAILLCLGGIVLLFRMLPTELAPREDRGLLRVEIRGPEGVNYPYMTSVMDQLDEVITSRFAAETEALISVTSPGMGGSSTANSGFARHVLKPPTERDRTQQEIAGALQRLVRDIPGADISVRQPGTFTARGRALPLQFVIQNPEFEKIEDIIPRFLEKARGRPELMGVQVDLVFNSPQIQIDIDRLRARSLGVSVSDVADMLQAGISGQRFGYYLKEGRQYEIIGQFEPRGRSTPADLESILLRTHAGGLVRLDNLARIHEDSAPPVLYRYNRFSAATLGANIAPEFTLGDGLIAIREVADEVLDDTFSTDLGGEAREMAETGRSMQFVFLLSLLLVYLVLAAQFESFRSPFVIMMTVPLALVGALSALLLLGQTLNIFSQIGLVMLIGLVTKNGILLVEFANQRRSSGSTPIQAAVEAASARFRPILMTTISTLLGTLPIALAIGSGSTSRIPLGIAVIGGLLVGTLLTLFVIPVLYSFLVPSHASLEKSPV